jgi:hypothetical protein
MAEFQPLGGKRGPVEVWLTKKNIEVTGRAIFEDETDTELTIWSASLRGAQREVTAWMIGRGYTPAGRWEWETGEEYETDGHDVGECSRAFQPPKGPKPA